MQVMIAACLATGACDLGPDEPAFAPHDPGPPRSPTARECVQVLLDVSTPTCRYTVIGTVVGSSIDELGPTRRPSAAAASPIGVGVGVNSITITIPVTGSLPGGALGSRPLDGDLQVLTALRKEGARHGCDGVRVIGTAQSATAVSQDQVRTQTAFRAACIVYR